ncbi:threonine--tRNA ligase [Candidatus Fermentibacteria bacterium]|nr:MAG: threonine--tRNA ligase [Candidatus Fermentibacteria bacterium]
MIRISFPDNSSTEITPETTGREVALSISKGLERKAVAFSLDGQVFDMSAPVPKEGSFRIITVSDPEAREILRHSAAHLMAAAVLELYPGTMFGVGPAIEDGFYYDMLIPNFGGEKDLDKIRNRMKRMVRQNIPFKRIEVTVRQALELFASKGDKFKEELIKDIDERGEKLSLYSLGDFTDLCRGPHVPSTKFLAAFDLLSVAGAYWRGSEENQMLTRIYGTAFAERAELDEHIKLLEEAKKRDHRKLGRELGLFSSSAMGGPGFIYWLPDGTIVKENLEGLWKDAHRAAGYQLVSTPHIAPVELWKTSGHYDYYKENMYFTEVENGEYALKPMNCPGHIIVYKSAKRSYRELPLRLAELGTVYRYERSGALHGLMRVRGFTVDDGHIFCTPDQIVSEIQDVVRFALYFLRIFGFGYKIELSLMDPANPEKYAGDPKAWAEVEPALAKALDEMGEEYTSVTGEAAFYGPKVDIKLRDALGRYWQGPTVQFDFNIPNRFDLNYTGHDGQEHRVYMVHRALFGSVERFIGNLIEHFAGSFPCWLSPAQLVILPITSAQTDFAEEVYAKAVSAGIRCRLDDRSETIGYRIRDAETGKVPFMFVIGQRETESGSVAVRRHGEGDLGIFSVESALAEVVQSCERPELPKRR